MHPRRAITATIPPNGSVAYPVGTTLNFAQDGAGAFTLAAGSGVTFKYSALRTLTSRPARGRLRGQGRDQHLAHLRQLRGA